MFKYYFKKLIEIKVFNTKKINLNILTKIFYNSDSGMTNKMKINSLS